ncbi:MAG: MarC family protein, partial [Halobacteriales archaeon]|nr:MarC family protein [Halobacteriales archaeon]
LHPDRPVAHDPSLVPLGLPMLAGPGAISLVILLGTQSGTVTGAATLAAAIVATMVGSLLVLLAAARASHVIGQNGRRVITRIMGLLTVAFAVQYVLDGVDGWLAARA